MIFVMSAETVIDHSCIVGFKCLPLSCNAVLYSQDYRMLTSNMSHSKRFILMVDLLLIFIQVKLNFININIISSITFMYVSNQCSSKRGVILLVLMKSWLLLFSSSQSARGKDCVCELENSDPDFPEHKLDNVELTASQCTENITSEKVQTKSLVWYLGRQV